MALTHSEKTENGSLAPDFSLPGVDGKIWKLPDFLGAKVLTVAFICNHCPYVIAVRDRINSLSKDYHSKGARLVAINSNDAVEYPDDNFVSMKSIAKEFGYHFPYLFDESQSVARAYGAVCTPDFFVYEHKKKEFRLAYRGRLDDNWKNESDVKKKDIRAALDLILLGQAPSSDQIPSMGCSIKWK